MNSVSLVLVIHDHQPVGNFDGVFREAAESAYEPFLAFLESHPRVRLALHTSGPLLQWFATHRRGYIERLRVLVERDQVEPWGGGFFEPVLVAIPETDRRGQIQAMADWLELELGRRPRGLWLTERVWEPGLAASLVASGVEYTAVDDAHFVAAGLERDRLWGIYQTEDQGHALKVLPIHRELRYAIPFAEPEETIALLRRVAAGGPDRIAVLGDDGEKFGVWPGTRELCYERHWLERFAAALDDNPWIRLRTPAEAIAEHPALGLVYLPTASYHEMQEWSLPPAGQDRYEQAAERLVGLFGDETHDLLRGGLWRNFQSRYPEANRAHKRAQRASHKLWKHAEPDSHEWKTALTHLWRAECNDAYWHGVFGGLYLPHLRSAVYRELIAAEAYLANGAAVETGDLDLDGDADALLETPVWAAWVTARGGALWAFDDRLQLCNYGDTLARRPEHYHRRLKEASVGGGEGKTIHEQVRLKEPGLAALVEHYDSRGRESFLDEWHEGGRVHDWAHDRFQLDASDRAGIVLTLAETESAPALEKRYLPAGAALEVRYLVTSSRTRRGALVVELNLGLHVPRADDRYVEIGDGPADPPHFAARARHASVTRAAFVDRWANRRLVIENQPAAALERAPIETVSLSEGGAERVFQGVEARYRFDVSLEPGTPWELCVRLLPGRSEPSPDSPRP